VRISLISPLWFAGIRHPGSRVFAAFSEAAPAADAGRQFIPWSSPPSSFRLRR